jgi:hypothetical protein
MLVVIGYNVEVDKAFNVVQFVNTPSRDMKWNSNTTMAPYDCLIHTVQWIISGILLSG